ncbi:hypothetical protein NLU13_7435 [Sarocladium strictum]|uniref:PLC-like phosphodiesterase n=1 Tax=Sarocladium strictum TaxID=5046 RepID=A0AA39GF61_SARSR|nr:hypothetical protein NLU13_7435 [Sarocladium strictum]
MVRITKIVAIFLLTAAQEALSAPVDNENAVLNGTNSELGAVSQPEFAEGTNSAASSDELVPGEERAVSVGNELQDREEKSGNTRRITLINATPYRWVRQSMSQYQIPDWNDAWPEYIESGDAFVAESNRYEGKYGRDTGGEVQYKLEGTCEDMGFEIKYNPGRAKLPDVRIKYLGALQTRWTPKGSEVNLGAYVVTGGVNWLLAGPENDFRSTNTPIGWMQEQIKDIGQYPLNQIVVPRAHHTGMNQGRTGVGVVYDETTLTQTRYPYVQMRDGGARVLDFRPYERSSNKMSAGHFSVIANLHHGMIGITLQEIINDINQFLEENPGEMVILDLHDKESWVGWSSYRFLQSRKFRPFEPENMRRLFKELEGLKNRFNLSTNAVDVHTRPLNDFIGDGKSAVLIHIPDRWAKDKSFPGAENGYVSNRNFPRTGYWSDTDAANQLQAEQTTTLSLKKNSRGGQIHDSQWVLRLATVQYIFPVLSLTDLARAAWGRMYGGIWNGSNDQVYPNWISLDAYQTEDARNLVMLMNRCLVARKCGKLGGKVPEAADLELPACKAKAAAEATAKGQSKPKTTP